MIASVANHNLRYDRGLDEVSLLLLRQNREPPAPLTALRSFNVPDSWKASIDFAAVTDIGMRRSNNQDSHVVVTADSPERFASHGHLFVVADGMGAHAAGELASRIATEQIPLYYLRHSGEDPRAALRNAVRRANEDIHQRGRQNPEFYNMGTTASVLAVLAEGAVVAHVGDSRVYRLRGDKLQQLTFDHSLVWEMQASGQIKPDSQLAGAIPKNVITRSLGPNPEVSVDIEGPFEIRRGDRFLLCSDGLTGQVPDKEIGPLLASLPADLAARVLVDLANLRGGPDNITVIVADVLAQDASGLTRRFSPRPTQLVSLPILAAVAVCLLSAAMLGIAGHIGPMIVALILGMIAGGFAVAQYRDRVAEASRDPEMPSDTPPRSGPYRSASAKPNAGLISGLDDVIAALKNAADERKWKIDWTEVDRLIAEGKRLRKQGNLAETTRIQGQVIVEMMEQLRSRRQSLEEHVAD